MGAIHPCPADKGTMNATAKKQALRLQEATGTNKSNQCRNHTKVQRNDGLVTSDVATAGAYCLISLENI